MALPPAHYCAYFLIHLRFDVVVGYLSGISMVTLIYLLLVDSDNKRHLVTRVV